MFRLSMAAALVCSSIGLAQDTKPIAAPATPQHAFLTKFVGEWDGDVEGFEPGKPPMKSKSKMTCRMLGNFWVALEVNGDAFGYHAQGTFGFDSTKTKKYIGTWADSMSDFMWKYEGKVDGNKLVLNSEGPDPSDPNKMIKAVDTWQFKDKDQVILTGEMQGPDGKMVTMVRITCNRTKGSTTRLSSYLLFDGNCKQAMEFYRSVFGGDLTLTTVGESPLKQVFPAAKHDRIVNARLISKVVDISASDWLHPTEKPLQGNTVCMYLSNGTPGDTTTVFQKLSADAKVTDPLGEQPFGLYGALNDKFGIRWMFHSRK